MNGGQKGVVEAVNAALLAADERVSALVASGDWEGQYSMGFVSTVSQVILDGMAIVPPAEHRLVGTGCACGEWRAALGESITRGFDLHLLDRRCDWCGEPIPTTKRVDAETCSDRCAKDRQRARVTPGGPDA